MSSILAQVLTYAAAAVLLAIVIFFALRAIDRLLDDLFPPSAEEVSRRQAERIAKQATKEFNQRQRRIRSWAWW
jgi:hypothetical protein